MQINFSMNSDEDISLFDLHKYISLLVSSKQMKLDKETEKYIEQINAKYQDFNEFSTMSTDELVKHKVDIETRFAEQMKEATDKFTKLTLIKEILEIDLNYYNKQLKNIKNIIKNDNFKISINIINDKIATNQDLTDIEKQQITFYTKLINQKIYIENVILSDKKIFKQSKKEEIKQQIFKEMKDIQNHTKIFIKENKDINVDYNVIQQTYNDYELQKLLSSLDQMIFEDTNKSVKYKMIDNLHKLTKKSYKEINMIVKDKKFKEKLFGNLKIETIQQKLVELSEKINDYKQIESYINQTKKIIYVCPVCNYNHDMPITVMLHMSLHKEFKGVTPISFSFFNNNGKKYSQYSVNPVEKMGDYLFEMKKNMNEGVDKNILVNSILTEYIDKDSFKQFQNPISLNKIIHQVDSKKVIEDFKNNTLNKFFFNNKKDFTLFNKTKEINKIVDEEINKIKTNVLFGENKEFTKHIRIINFRVFKTIFASFLNEDDILNLYNSVIEYYDNNLKSENNTSFDLLFKNMIHYNNRKPIEVTYQMFKKLFKIIKGIKEQKFAELLFILGTKKVDKEAYEYVDTSVLLLLIPLLQSLDLLNNVSDNLEGDDDIKVNEDFHPSSWTDSKNYQKLVNKISNITKDNLIINTNNQRQTAEIMEQFSRLSEMFQNIDMKKLKRMERQYDLIYESFNFMVKNNMFLHDINEIDSNKSVQEKYNEYMNGTFLIITLKYMMFIVKENTDNTENTKMLFDSFFKTVSLYLTEESKYLKKNTVVRRKVVRQVQNIVDNRDDLLNEYFESDDEDFNEEVGDEEELVEEDNEMNIEEELFGYESE